MTTIVFLVLMGLGYLLMTFAAFVLGNHMRTVQVGELRPSRDDPAHYSFELTKRQKGRQELWEIVMLFSPLWPLELVAGLIRLLLTSTRTGVKQAVETTSRSAHRIEERKKVLLLEEERARLVDKGELTSVESAKMKNLDSMIFHMKPQPKALTSK